MRLSISESSIGKACFLTSVPCAPSLHKKPILFVRFFLSFGAMLCYLYDMVTNYLVSLAHTKEVWWRSNYKHFLVFGYRVLPNLSNTKTLQYTDCVHMQLNLKLIYSHRSVLIERYTTCCSSARPYGGFDFALRILSVCTTIYAGEWLASRSGRFTPGADRNRYPHLYTWRSAGLRKCSVSYYN